VCSIFNIAGRISLKGEPEPKSNLSGEIASTILSNNPVKPEIKRELSI
jgi:hypothetical protein